MTKITPVFDGVPVTRPPSENWIDRATPAGGKVGLLVAFNQSELNTENTWWALSFWNRSVQRDYVLPGGDTFAQGYITGVAPDLATGALDGVAGTPYLAKLSTDMRLGLRGSPLATQGIEDLYRLHPGAPLTYSTVGVDQTGTVDIHSAPLIRFYGNGATPVRDRVTVTFEVLPPDPGCPCTLYTGTRTSAVPLPHPSPVGTDVAFSRTIELPPHGGVTVPLVVRGRGGGVPAALTMILAAVQISPA
jgi:hypothetical protein